MDHVPESQSASTAADTRSQGVLYSQTLLFPSVIVKRASQQLLTVGIFRVTSASTKLHPQEIIIVFPNSKSFKKAWLWSAGYWFTSHCTPFISPREVKLSVVSYLTNSIVDQILQELYATHKTLVNMVKLFVQDDMWQSDWDGLSVSESAAVSSETLGRDVWRWNKLEVKQTQRLFGHHGRRAQHQHRKSKHKDTWLFWLHIYLSVCRTLSHLLLSYPLYTSSSTLYYPYLLYCLLF